MGKEPSERGRLAQREDLEKCQRMEGEDLLMPTRILFRLEIRKYLGLFYIAPSFWKREKETTGRETDGGGGSFKSKIEWKAPSPEGRREKPLLALHLCEMRNIYARMLLKGGTAEKEGERGKERAPHTLTYSVALAGCMKGMFTPPPRSHPGIIRGTRTTRPHFLVLSMLVSSWLR